MSSRIRNTQTTSVRNDSLNSGTMTVASMIMVYSLTAPGPIRGKTRCRASVRTLAVVSLALILAVWSTVAASPPESRPAVPPTSPSAERKDRTPTVTQVGEGFRVRETEHFTIAYDTSYEALRPLVGRLEGTYDAIRRFCKDSGLIVQPERDLLHVLLFDRYDHFEAYLQIIQVPARSVAGVYHQQTNIAAFCNVLNSPGLAPVAQQIEQLQQQLQRAVRAPPASQALRKRREDIRNRLAELRNRRDALVRQFNRFVLQHEAAHQVLYNLGVHVRGADNPIWLVEGLACQFEVPQAGALRPMTRINHLRLADFRDALRVSPDARKVADQAYRVALEEHRLIPVADLVAQKDLLVGTEGHDAFRYAQAWALVHYLNREHREAFAAYLRVLSKRKIGKPIERERNLSEFQAAFGEPDEAFERTWVDWMLRLRFDHHEAGR